MTKIFTATLPVPPSVNDIYGTSTVRTKNGKNTYHKYLKKTVVKWKDEISKLLINNDIRFSENERLRVIIQVSFNRDGRDLDNINKVLLDIFNHKHLNIYYDDSQIDEIHMFRDVNNKKNPKIHIMIMEME